MKCKVIRRFIDKNTYEVQEIGTAYECTKERFNEVQKMGNFLQEVREPKPKKKAEE